MRTSSERTALCRAMALMAIRCTLILAAMTLLFPSLRCAADIFGTGGNHFEIEFVTIGDPGNAPDTTGNPNPAGSVDYVYRIGKHEISRDMVEKANAEGEETV